MKCLVLPLAFELSFGFCLTQHPTAEEGARVTISRSPLIYLLASMTVSGTETTLSAREEVLVPGSPKDGIATLLVDATEVSEAQFERFRLKHEKGWYRWPEAPASNMTRAQAEAYCGSLDKRLPTEAEWQWIARSGKKTLGNPWTNLVDACEFAVLADPVEGAGCGYQASWPVTSLAKGATAQGVHHMAGNVAEWTSTDTADGLAVVRGGSFRSTAEAGGIFERRTVSHGDDDIGFRCVREARNDK